MQNWKLPSDIDRINWIKLWDSYLLICIKTLLIQLICGEPTQWKRPWCWERLKVGGEEDNRGWDGWMVSLTQWTWVWVGSSTIPHIFLTSTLQTSLCPGCTQDLTLSQFSSDTQSCLTLWDPMDCSTQASLSITNSQSLLKLMSIKSVTPPNHFILCHPLLLLPSIFPSIRVFSSESVLHIRWLNYWSFSFSISLSNEYSGLISFRTHRFKRVSQRRQIQSKL